ncbi:MAG: hypothetical protein A2904_00065 [Candidatus Staskawiczbacteria bacterium RIFCSPLOWO2_01_FULL_33_9]|uniref:Uncharacterized protein n=1 Tax=Candidatus Staskawiczbacteria bacterium RIFCSPLOWO2_01_FULL_33_9 TaxID=1802211 RepID=A0A1G2I693_9BACT|nr:MAG: hypothetical protein A2904_00065 [Candidatus Staskawiczbacteria bacterium RIFCSPLOWO2_01_FULL_33_9]
MFTSLQCLRCNWKGFFSQTLSDYDPADCIILWQCPKCGKTLATASTIGSPEERELVIKEKNCKRI